MLSNLSLDLDQNTTMAISRIMKEYINFKNDEKMGILSVPHRIEIDELNFFKWKIQFDLSIDHTLLDTVEVEILFPSDYAFHPPRANILTSGYSQILICFNEWSPFMRMTFIIPHIYFSIIDAAYYRGNYLNLEENEESENREEKSLPPQPSQESVAPQPSYHFKD